MRDPAIKNCRAQLELSRQQAKLNPQDKTTYKENLKKYKKRLKEIKNNFFRKSLSSRDPKAVWSTIHRVLDNQKSRIKHHPSEMNDYYCKLASELTGKPNEESTLPDNIETIDDENAFKIHHVTYDEVCQILKSLKNDCSCGSDNISIRFVKPISEFITSPLVNIINNCIDKKIFPRQWKIARVCPIPKIDLPIKIKDYRPISVLPVLSKVFERVILHQLCKFIEDKALYRQTQSGFRKGHSTTTLLIKLRDDIKKAMSKSEVTLSILIDYSKAFDTIDHLNLLLKLRDMNFSSDSLQILSSYLLERRQYVQVEDKTSSLKPMYFGVPQGSILGPVLFNLYVVELSDQVTSSSIQYADDTTLYRHCKLKDLQETIKDMEKDVENLQSWSKDSNLLFNSDKLQLIIFHSQRLRNFPKNQSQLFRCSGRSIEHKTYVKLLGVYLDHNLTWSTHINEIIKSSQGTLRALRKFSRFTPFHVRKTLAETMILSKLNYSNVVYAQIPKYQVERLQKIQNIAAGYVLSRFATLNDVIQLKWLPVKEYIELNTAKIVHKSRRDKNHPSYLNVEFSNPSKKLRCTLKEPMIKVVNDGTFQCQARWYDDLPENIKSLKTLEEFNKEAKKYYFDKALARVLSL